jgi:hypothetical protein
MDKRYVFRGNASGVGARIVRPINLVTTAAASSLSVIGGVSESYVDSASIAGGGLVGKLTSLFRSNVSYSGVLSFKSARTKANGAFSEKDKGFNTAVNSTVLGLNVENRLTAGTLESNILSRHPDNGQEPPIVPSGRIPDLQVDGYPIVVTIDDLFSQYPTKESLSKAYATDNAFYERYGKRFQKSNKDKTDSANRQLPEISGFVVSTIVSKVETKHPKIVVDGHILILEGFGRIYLGEILISSAYRRLTLLRCKLGSPVEGDLACAEVESNGIILD